MNAVDDALRAWAKGLYPTEAAVELLIRGFGGRFADSGNPWIRSSSDNPGRWFVDFAAIPDRIGGLSGGERRYLMIAAAMGCGVVQVNLWDGVSGLDRHLLDLVLAAIAHAGGSHEHGHPVPVGVNAAGNLTFVVSREGSLHAWPEQAVTR